MNARRVESIEVREVHISTRLDIDRALFQEFVAQCDVTTVNAPLHEGTLNLVNKNLLKHFKPVKPSFVPR